MQVCSILLVFVFTIACSSGQDGRNDGEPDYYPDDPTIVEQARSKYDAALENDFDILSMDLDNEELGENGPNYNPEGMLIDSRDAGRNEGEPDYDTNTSSGNDSKVVERQTRNCDGVPSTDWSCCASSRQCSIGKGDCDRDSDCAGGLVCGTNNCRPGASGSNWHRAADCCIAPVAPNCDGIPSTDWSCCSSSNKCNVGEGDCDRDGDCADGLICGTDNCRPGMTGSRWSSYADCCIAPPPTSPPSTVSCGIKPSRIVGGGAVTPYSLPWQVALVRRGQSSPFCGGILISERHVLTAAHCMVIWPIDVIVGEHSVTSSSDGTRHTTCRYRNHPSWNSNTVNYDFAILHLNQPVALGARAVPACLPTSSFGGNFLAGKQMTVSGWGALSEGSTVSPTVLHKVDVPGMTNAQCSTNYQGQNQVTNAMLCAGQAGGGIDSCQGDSGGPLTYTSGGKTYVVGVVSWGIGCARPGKPGVYARVTSALPFIQSEMSQTC